MISEYLALGTGLNLSLGYIFKNNYAIDFGYSKINPEYEENLNSVISSNDDLRVSLSKYFLENKQELSKNILRYLENKLNHLLNSVSET